MLDKLEILNGELKKLAYDFSGKTIIPFCTSGGSGVGRSDEELHKNVKGNVEWKKGTQINRPDETVIRGWLDEVL